MKTLSILCASGLLASNLSFGGNLLIAPDASASAPIFSSIFADGVAMRAQDKIKTLEYADKVTVTTFGDGGVHHVKKKSLQISRLQPREDAAVKVANEIKQFAQNYTPEGSTNIIGFIEENKFDCSKDGSEVWLLTDGVENSDSFSAEKLLKGKPLPDPFEKTLEGCKVVMIGIGRNADGSRMPRKQIQRLKKAWTDWLMKAGAVDVEISVNP